MMRVVVLALALAVVVPAASIAVPRPPEPRLHPQQVAARPSYVGKVERAIVGVKVRARADAPSTARLGAELFTSGVIFDPRGYAVTVSYALIDAIRVEVTTRDNNTVSATVVGVDYASGLGVVG